MKLVSAIVGLEWKFQSSFTHQRGPFPIRAKRGRRSENTDVNLLEFARHR